MKSTGWPPAVCVRKIVASGGQRSPGRPVLWVPKLPNRPTARCSHDTRPISFFVRRPAGPLQTGRRFSEFPPLSSMKQTNGFTCSVNKLTLNMFLNDRLIIWHCEHIWLKWPLHTTRHVVTRTWMTIRGQQYVNFVLWLPWN